MAYLSPEENRAIRSGTLSLDCIQMVLERRGGESTYRGAGLIRQDGTGVLEFTLYDPEYKTDADDMFRAFLRPSGGWVPDDDLYDLRATDLQGRIWSAERIYPDENARVGEPGVFVRGRIRSLTARFSEPSRGHSYSLFIPGDIRIPTNAVTETHTLAAGRTSRQKKRNLWLPVGAPYDFVFSQTDRGLEIRVYAKTGKFSDGFDTRLEEALWFLTARPVLWLTLREVKKGMGRLCIRPVETDPLRPRVGPPLHPSHDTSCEDSSGLLMLYLSHVQYFIEEYFHPLSVAIRNVLRASAATIHDEALALSVSVETILRLYFETEGEPDENTKLQVKGALKHMKKWDGEHDVKHRISTAIGQIKGTNPRSALRKLVDNGVVKVEHRDAWERLRHPAAHGWVTDIDIHDLEPLCDRVFQLMAILIFVIIDYEGEMTDYCSHDVSSVHFPRPGP